MLLTQLVPPWTQSKFNATVTLMELISWFLLPHYCYSPHSSCSHESTVTESEESLSNSYCPGSDSPETRLRRGFVCRLCMGSTCRNIAYGGEIGKPDWMSTKRGRSTVNTCEGVTQQDWAKGEWKLSYCYSRGFFHGHIWSWARPSVLPIIEARGQGLYLYIIQLLDVRYAKEGTYLNRVVLFSQGLVPKKDSAGSGLQRTMCPLKNEYLGLNLPHASTL